MSPYSTRSTGGNWLTDSVTRNPEGLLLLAAGCALLLRKAANSRSENGVRVKDAQWPGRNLNRSDEPMGNNAPDHSLRETVANAARSVGEYASNVSEKVTERASEYASSAADYADQASTHARDMGRQAGSALQSSAQAVLQNQPLAVAVAGFAVGAAVAAAFPATEMERRNLGPTGERLKDAAVSAGAQIKGAGMQAKEKLASVVEEHGLTAGGLKDMAQEVTEAFSDALSDDKASTAKSSRTPSASQTYTSGRNTPGEPRRGAR